MNLPEPKYSLSHVRGPIAFSYMQTCAGILHAFSRCAQCALHHTCIMLSKTKVASVNVSRATYLRPLLVLLQILASAEGSWLSSAGLKQFVFSSNDYSTPMLDKPPPCKSGHTSLPAKAQRSYRQCRRAHTSVCRFRVRQNVPSGRRGPYPDVVR